MNPQDTNKNESYPLYGFTGFDDPAFRMVAFKLEHWLKSRITAEETDFEVWNENGTEYCHIAFGERSWVITRDSDWVCIYSQETVIPVPPKRELLVSTPKTYQQGDLVIPAVTVYSLDGELIEVSEN